MVSKEETNAQFIDALYDISGLIDPARTLTAFKFFYERGHLVALRDAINYCREISKKFQNDEQSYLFTNAYFFPDWVLSGMVEAIEKTYDGKGTVLGKGKLGNSNALFKSQQNHLARYLAVRAARSEKDSKGKNLQDYAAFGRASELLEGATADADIEQVRKSYYKVQAEIISDSFFKDYYPLVYSIADIEFAKPQTG